MARISCRPQPRLACTAQLAVTPIGDAPGKMADPLAENRAQNRLGVADLIRKQKGS